MTTLDQMREERDRALVERDEAKALAETWAMREAAQIEANIRNQAEALSENQAARAEVEVLRGDLRTLAWACYFLEGEVIHAEAAFRKRADESGLMRSALDYLEGHDGLQVILARYPPEQCPTPTRAAPPAPTQSTLASSQQEEEKPTPVETRADNKWIQDRTAQLEHGELKMPHNDARAQAIEDACSHGDGPNLCICLACYDEARGDPEKQLSEKEVVPSAVHGGGSPVMGANPNTETVSATPGAVATPAAVPAQEDSAAPRRETPGVTNPDEQTSTRTHSAGADGERSGATITGAASGGGELAASQPSREERLERALRAFVDTAQVVLDVAIDAQLDDGLHYTQLKSRLEQAHAALAPEAKP